MVGGGIAGVATAIACHELDLGSVLLIEAGRLGSGATGGAAGLLTPEPHEWSDPEPFVELARASLDRSSQLDESVPGGVGLVELDWIGLAPDPGGFAPHLQPAVEWLEPGDVASLVPGLARPMAGALIRHQARSTPCGRWPGWPRASPRWRPASPPSRSPSGATGWSRSPPPPV